MKCPNSLTATAIQQLKMERINPDISRADLQVEIDKLKVLYISKLNEIFNSFVDQYAPDRKVGLRIVA